MYFIKKYVAKKIYVKYKKRKTYAKSQFALGCLSLLEDTSKSRYILV